MNPTGTEEPTWRIGQRLAQTFLFIDPQSYTPKQEAQKDPHPGPWRTFASGEVYTELVASQVWRCRVLGLIDNQIQGVFHSMKFQAARSGL